MAIPQLAPPLLPPGSRLVQLTISPIPRTSQVANVRHFEAMRAVIVAAHPPYVFCRRVLTDYHRVALTVPADKLANMAPEQGGTVLAAALQRVLAEPGFRERVAAVSRRLRAHRQPPVAQVLPQAVDSSCVLWTQL